jgi:hypothetical protein
MFVQRDAGGHISGLFANASPDASEFLPDTDPQVIAYQAKTVMAIPHNSIAVDALLARLTNAEYLAIIAKIKADLVAAAVLTQARADEIFG